MWQQPWLPHPIQDDSAPSSAVAPSRTAVSSFSYKVIYPGAPPNAETTPEQVTSIAKEHSSRFRDRVLLLGKQKGSKKRNHLGPGRRKKKKSK